MIERVEQVLRKHWGYNSFLPLQKEAMQCVCSGRDSVVVLPTGGGKSLCFQAPALTMPGLAIVVSPLISLMKDQVDALAECGVPAARLDSSLSPQVRKAVRAKIERGTLKLLYLSPERLVSEGFIRFLKGVDLSLIAVDEAHCISMWGHNFRPEYRELRLLKNTFPGIPIHAYTATATEQVRGDIARLLRLEDPAVLVGSFDRPNLVYKVERRTEKLKQVCAVLDRHREESGIVYCIRRADVDEMSARLTEGGYRVVPYHAGMQDEDRKRSQESFIQEKVDTIVATVAFGMGIDKSNVRYVIHAGMPKSVEHYHQESGRAGRDGLEAECCLFYSGGDYGIWRRILGDIEPEEAREIALNKLNKMYDYCRGVTCRHKTILDYFGQGLEKSDCEACDVCLGELDRLDNALETGQNILSCIVRLDERFGADYTACVLIGSREERILSNQHDTLTTYGVLSDFPKRVVRDWIEQLVTQGYIQKTEEYSVLKITAKGWRLLKGKETPSLLKPAKKRARVSRAAKDSWEGVDKGLFELLRKLRREIAGTKGVPAYIVFSDAALRDMARRRPSAPEGFLEVRGVGNRKSGQYGDRFLAVIQKYCLANSVDMDVKPSHEVRPSVPQTDALPERASRDSSSNRKRLDEIRSKHPRAYEAWTEQEQQKLRRHLSEGRSVIEIASLLGRRPGAIESRIKKLELESAQGDPGLE